MKIIFNNKQDLELYVKEAIDLRKKIEEQVNDPRKIKNIIDFVRTLKEFKELVDARPDIGNGPIGWLNREYPGEYNYGVVQYIN